MIAHLAKDQKIVYRTINARAETVDPAGIQQAPLPAVAAREHKIACIFDFGFCDATVTPNG
jgi:hypothetical protein